MPFDLPPEVLGENVCKFFWKFSVIEYALKKNGFLKGSKSYVQPDWNKFAQKIDGCFGDVTIVGFEEACCKLKENPPKQQIIDGNRLGWGEPKEQGGKSSEEYIVCLVKRIRNNLFHGGKYPSGLVDSIERDSELIDAALVVLEGLLQLLKKVETGD